MKELQKVWEDNKHLHKGRYPVSLFEAGFVTGLLMLSTWIRENERTTAQTNRIQLELNTLLYDLTGTIKRIEDLCQHKSHSSET